MAYEPMTQGASRALQEATPGVAENPQARAQMEQRAAMAREEAQRAEREEQLAAQEKARANELASIQEELYKIGVPTNQVANVQNLNPAQLANVKSYLGIDMGRDLPETALMPPPEEGLYKADIETALADQESALRDEYAGLFGEYRGRLADIRNRTRGAADAERLSAEASSAANVARLEEEGRARAEFREEYRELAKQQEVASRIRRESKDKARRDIDDAVSEVREMRINPNRIFHNTSSRVVAAIAAGLGEFGRQLQGGGTNTALQIINSAIDRDIDAQKQAIRTAEVGVRMQENSYKRLLDLHGDDEKAEMLARHQALEFAKMKVGEITDRYKVPLEKSKLSGLIAGIDKGLLQTELALADKEFSSRVAELRARPKAKAVEFNKDEANFFRMFSDFRTELANLKDMYRGTGKYKDLGPLKGEAISRIFSEKLMGKDALISGLGRTLGTHAAQFYETGARLSKSFSEIKEAGKISDMDLVFYLERVPLPDDSDVMIEAKIEALDAFAEKAMELRLGFLTPAAFRKANKLLQAQMSSDGLTTVSPEERSNLIKRVYGKKEPAYQGPWR
tara:strand:+ start:29131 stop:30837 length:1707 start_codon:yes stop_codon:yes gene_type:complete